MFIPVLFIIILVVMLGMGLAIGWGIHELIPSIDLAAGAIIGTIATATSFHFVGRLAWKVKEIEEDGIILDELFGEELAGLDAIEKPLPRRRRDKRSRSQNPH